MTRPDRIRIAVGQPKLVMTPDPEENVARAVDLTARAAGAEARLLLLPEGAPGPYRAPESYDPPAVYDAAPVMAEAASRYGIAVCWSRIEQWPDGHNRLTVYVHDRDGTQVARYGRSHPATLPAEQTGSWIAPGDELCDFVLDGVHFGIVVCSELWVPEPSRVLAIRGAEVLLSPAGGHFTALSDNWQAIARARAIENLCHVALTNNIHRAELGSARIIGPESVLTASGTEDLLVATCDLARARWLRDNDDSLEEPKPFRSIPGLVRARRPELYSELVSAEPGVYDYVTPQDVASAARDEH